MKEDTTPVPPPSNNSSSETPVAGPCGCSHNDPALINRRRFFTALSLGLTGFCTVLLGVPLVGFIIAPLFRPVPEKWTPIGRVSDFELGKTVNVTITDPSPLPWAGISAKNAAWIRREAHDHFIAFSVNCTHLGCPVRWLPDAELFMCPCHGGVYYKDGNVAAGPPPRPLYRYNIRVQGDQVLLRSVVVPITTSLS